jgi:hypothetical protein
MSFKRFPAVRRFGTPVAPLRKIDTRRLNEGGWMRFVCLLTVLALCGCGGDDPTAQTTEPTWELVACDDFHEEMWYGPTHNPIGVSRSWSSTIPIPPGATVMVSLCNFYDQVDGVFTPDDGAPPTFPRDGCQEIDHTAEVSEDGEVYVRCKDEIILFDDYYDYQTMPVPDEIITDTVFGWEEVYILVIPGT